MSILSDLDPKNTRLPTGKTRASNPGLWWLLALLLLLGGGVWLYYTTLDHPAGAETDATRPEFPPPLAMASTAGESSARMVPGDTAESSVANTAGSAIIKVSEAVPANSPSVAIPQAVTEATGEMPIADRQQRPLTPAIPEAGQRKRAPQPELAKRVQKTTAKAKKSSSTRVATNQRPQKTINKNLERDIDIISVIVR